MSPNLFSKIHNNYVTSLLCLTVVLAACDKEKITSIGTPVTKPGGWTPLFFNIETNLNDVYFVDNNVGWIVGENQTLLSTTTADLGWNQAPVLSPLENLRNVYFVNDQLGWIVGDLSGNPISGQIAYSSNGGGYPSQQETVEDPLNALFFIDNQLGWAAGENGLLVNTKDGGSNWSVVTPFTSNKINDIYFLDGTTGWAVTSQGGIFFTKDGTTWQQDESGITDDIYSIHFVDTLGWACGDKNTILRMESGPQNSINWIRYTIDNESVNIKWNDIFFVDETTGWLAGESGNLYKSIDGGISWIQDANDVTSDLNAIHMVSTRRGWVVGDDAVILSYREN